MTHETVDNVLEELDEIVDWAIESRHRAGYFAALYRRVTRRIKHEIETGRFEDAERMKRLDIAFASRYFEAFRTYRSGGRPTQSWGVAFERAEKWSPLILQHLLLGMNAHINLDLGIAAAQVAPGSSLPALHDDFHVVSDILCEMLDDVQDRVGQLSPWMGMLDRFGGRADEAVSSFSLRQSRSMAWSFAERLADLPSEDREREIRSMDGLVSGLARTIRRGGFLLRPALRAIRLREPNDAARVIRTLSA
jgi:hypothetical protein